jgi:hypothetical protein
MGGDEDKLLSSFSSISSNPKKLGGAAEARRAHNPEVTRSKRIQARFLFFFLFSPSHSLFNFLPFSLFLKFSFPLSFSFPLFFSPFPFF